MTLRISACLGILFAASCLAAEIAVENSPVELQPGESATRTFKISSDQFANGEGKRAYLEVLARVTMGSVTGFTPGLRVFYNGDELKTAANRNAVFLIGDDREIISYEEGKGWTLLYGPSTSALENPPAQYAPKDPAIDAARLLFPLDIDGGKGRPATEGEIFFETTPPEYLENSVVIESIAIRFLSESELPTLQ